MGQRLHHAAHATHSGSTHRHFWFIFFLFHNYTFCSQEHTCNRSGIFQSYTSYLSRIYHTGSVQVFVNISTGIVTEVTFTFAYFLYYYCTFLTCIGNNLTKRFLDRRLIISIPVVSLHYRPSGLPMLQKHGCKLRHRPERYLLR